MRLGAVVDREAPPTRLDARHEHRQGSVAVLTSGQVREEVDRACGINNWSRAWALGAVSVLERIRELPNGAELVVVAASVVTADTAGVAHAARIVHSFARGSVTWGAASLIRAFFVRNEPVPTAALGASAASGSRSGRGTRPRVGRLGVVGSATGDFSEQHDGAGDA